MDNKDKKDNNQKWFEQNINDPEISDEVYSSNNSDKVNEEIIIDNKSPPNVLHHLGNYWFNKSMKDNEPKLSTQSSSKHISINIPSSLNNNINIENSSEKEKEEEVKENKFINKNIIRKKSLKQISDEEIGKIVVDEELYQSCCEISSCCQKLVKFEVDSYAIIRILPLSSFRKEILRRRYSDTIGNYQQTRDCIRFTYRLFQIIISIGSVIVPALLSVHMTEYVQTNDYDIQINICVLILSIVVSICTNVIYIFKLDEMYHLYAITVEKLTTLWFHYSSLSGPFLGTTHNTSFAIFVNMMEEIIINQKFQEYVDSKSDKNKPKQEQDYFYKDLQEYNNIITNYNNFDENYINDDNQEVNINL